MASYRLGSADFDTDNYEISVEGHKEHLQPQVRKVLLCLLRHREQVVPKQMLLAEAWNGRTVSDECLTRCISLLRKHLHDRQAKHLIETIPTIGYRLHSEPPPGVPADPGPLPSSPQPPGLLTLAVMLAAGTALAIVLMFVVIMV